MTPNETFTALSRWHLLPTTSFTWRPFSATAIYVTGPGIRRVYQLDLSTDTVEIFQSDPHSDLSEHFVPLKTVVLTAAQMKQLPRSQSAAS